MTLTFASALAPGGRDARAADSCNWLGDEMPLPLPVETPRDLSFKTAAERQYLIFNLLAGGKVALQRGDYATAVQKWEMLLRAPGLDPQIASAVTPFLLDARGRLKQSGVSGTASGSGMEWPGTPPAAQDPTKASTTKGAGEASAEQGETVNGVVSGGGQMGPGGAVVWLHRLDGPMPRVVPSTGVITQRDKVFIPHVLVVPVGSSVEFRNDDRIYHNVFSLTRPNDFDAGVRAAGLTYVRKFEHSGPVDLLCNIHATMSAFVYVVDSPFFAKALPTGVFRIRNVPAGAYELLAWHEASSIISRKKITVGPGEATRVSIAVGGDRRPGPFAPDKYGHSRQSHLGY